MLSDYKPIIFNTSKEHKEVEVYFAHDVHYGSEQHDKKKWERFKKNLLTSPNKYVIFVGDLLENAIPGSKSDIMTQTASPQEQKEWVLEQFLELKDRIVAVTDGNHEHNRSAKAAGLYPVYDCCVMAGIQDRYRPNFAFVDIGVGETTKNRCGQVRYMGYCTHKAADLKKYCSADFVEGVDFMAYGHDHDPKSHPRAKLVYDSKVKSVTKRPIEVVNSGSFLWYGGYATRAGYRPSSDAMFKLTLNGSGKKFFSSDYYL